jgi:hypothetical protein
MIIIILITAMLLISTALWAYHPKEIENTEFYRIYLIVYKNLPILSFSQNFSLSFSIIYLALNPDWHYTFFNI